MSAPKTNSFRQSTLDAIGNFLYNENFLSDGGVTQEGILEIINLLSDYYEEGNHLFPEVLITNDLVFLKAIPNHSILIRETELSVKEFKNAIKLCAPLTNGSWVIFIEINSNKIKYGVITTEIAITSPSLYEHAVGLLHTDNNKTIAYIKNVGTKTVEVLGLKNKLTVPLTLDIQEHVGNNPINTLVEEITSECDSANLAVIRPFLQKTIDEALKNGHGNLIGIVESSPSAISQLKETVKENGGVYLTTPISLYDLIIDAESVKDNESTLKLKSFAAILRSMLNHDGITIINTQGEILGYHILIDSFIEKDEMLDGGARSKAYKSMINCKAFKFCLFKSQNGIIKTWKRE